MNSGSHPLPVRPARADFATCAAGDIVPGRKAWDFVRPGTGRISFSTHLSHAARRVFILHAQTHVCAFTRALRRVFIRLLPLLTRRKACFHSSSCPPLTRRKACFHPSCAKRTFVLSHAPSGAFSCVCCPFSHAARRVFILHAQTHVCAFTRALWRVFIRFSPHAAQPRALFRTRTCG